MYMKFYQTLSLIVAGSLIFEYPTVNAVSLQSTEDYQLDTEFGAFAQNHAELDLSFGDVGLKSIKKKKFLQKQRAKKDQEKKKKEREAEKVEDKLTDVEKPDVVAKDKDTPKDDEEDDGHHLHRDDEEDDGHHLHRDDEDAVEGPKDEKKDAKKVDKKEGPGWTDHVYHPQEQYGYGGKKDVKEAGEDDTRPVIFKRDGNKGKLFDKNMLKSFNKIAKKPEAKTEDGKVTDPINQEVTSSTPKKATGSKSPAWDLSSLGKGSNQLKKTEKKKKDTKRPQIAYSKETTTTNKVRDLTPANAKTKK